MRRFVVLVVTAALLSMAAPSATVLASGPTPDASVCSGPALISPADAATVTSETIAFSWNPVSGCTFNGYTLRVRADADFDGDVSLDLIDIEVGETSLQVTIPSGHRDQALYWAVKAAGARTEASWSSGTFQIVPPADPTPPSADSVSPADGATIETSSVPSPASASDSDGGGRALSIAPAAPANVGATALSSSSIQFTWADNSSDEDGFRIFRWSAPTGSPWVVAGTAGANATSFTDTELDHGTGYFYYACAYNDAGESCAPGWVGATTLSGPVAPANVGATALSSRSIQFTWADNSSDEDGFRIYRWSVPDGLQWVQAGATGPNTTTFVDTELLPATRYFYYACAHNILGEVCAAGWLDATTLSGLPTAPTGISATAGNASTQISWTAPASDGGSPITSYLATSSPGGWTCSTSGLSCAISGLTNGTAYTFTVVARNVDGTGPASSASAAVTPRTVPGAPTGVTTTPANTSVRVTWTAPASNGGSAITSYTATSSPGARTCTTTGSSCTVSGLTNGTAYTFTVTAANVAGTGSASGASAAVTPRTVPGAPTGVTARPGTGQALVSWVAPVSNGGSAIIGYTAISSPGGKTCTSVGLSCWVTGLTNGTAYTFTVTATNAGGTGAASTASAAVTPSAVVVKPTASMAALATYQTTTTVTVTWGATPGSAPVTGYDVRYRRAPWNGSFGGWVTGLAGTTTTIGTLSGAPGNTYCFSVIAHGGDGGVSAPTAETCTVVPLDERSLSRSGSWSLGSASAYYKDTYGRSSSSGAKLTRTGVVAKRIAIVATTCSTCGKVRVYWGSTLLKTISLYSATTVNKKVITVTTFSSARSGTLSLRVYGSGKKVIIDGVAIGRK